MSAVVVKKEEKAHERAQAKVRVAFAYATKEGRGALCICKELSFLLGYRVAGERNLR